MKAIAGEKAKKISQTPIANWGAPNLSSALRTYRPTHPNFDITTIDER